jgi:hypothetical protein
VIAGGTVTGLTRLLLKIVASIEEEDFPHLGFREFLKLRGMAGLADLSAYIGGLLSRLSFCSPNRMGKDKKEKPH